MTALTADRHTKYKRITGETQSYPVAASTKIYKGSFVCLNASGYLVPGAATAGLTFVGIAKDGVDNSSGANGAKTCEAFKDGRYLMAKSGTITQADIGLDLKLADDQTAALNQASLTTSMTGTNNDVTVKARPQLPGLDGELVSLTLVDPSANDQTIAVTVSGRDISVSLATGPAGAITTTAALLIAAIEASAAATALVDIGNAASNDGSGVVTALSKTFLDGAGISCGVLEEIESSQLWVRIDEAVH